MLASRKIYDIISRLVSDHLKKDTMLYGKVASISPLSIKISDKIILPASMLELSPLLQPIKVKMPHTHQYNGTTEKASATSLSPSALQKGDLNITFAGSGALTVVEPTGHQHDIKNQVTEDTHKQGTTYEQFVTIEIEPKLQVGDTVLLLAQNNFQKYYVAKRIEK